MTACTSPGSSIEQLGSQAALHINATNFCALCINLVNAAIFFGGPAGGEVELPHPGCSDSLQQYIKGCLRVLYHLDQTGTGQLGRKIYPDLGDEGHPVGNAAGQVSFARDWAAAC
jgi:hypothetical protein